MSVTNHPLLGQRVRLTGEGWSTRKIIGPILRVDAHDGAVWARRGPGLAGAAWVWVDDPDHPFAGEVVRTIYGSRSRNLDPLPWADGHTDAAGNPRRFAEPYHVDGDGTDCQWCVTEYRPRPEYDAAPIHPVNPILVELRKVSHGEVARIAGWLVDDLWAGRNVLGVIATPEQIEHARRVIERLAALS